MSAPKVSVCIDVYNYEAFLPKAIDSVLQQKFTDFEVIVVDDCSKDRSFEIAKSYAAKDSRVVALRNPANLGMVRNRNACLRPAKGEYVKILHADDFFRADDALGKMASVLDANRGVSLVSCAMQFVDTSLQKLKRWSYFEDRKPVTGTTVITRSLRERRNLIGGPSAVMFRRAKGLRGFDEKFFHSADWEMWLHLLEQGCFSYIDEALVAYRKHDHQQTEKDKLTLTQYEDQLGILDRYLDRPYVRISKLNKAYLRHKAVADFVTRSRQLGLPDGETLVKKYGSLKFNASTPSFALYRQFLQLRRVADRALPRRQAPQKATPSQLESHPAGVNVAGFFKAIYGVGDASRTFCKAFVETGLPMVSINIQSGDHKNADESIEGFTTDNPYSVNIATFSFDYARRFFRDMGPRFFKGRYNIALWYWELEKFPVRWHPAFEYYDEIWVNTTFCQQSFADVSPIPITRIDYPFYQSGEPAQSDREGFSFGKDSWLFLFNFDFHSVLQRKNPDGLISAFKKAFDPKKDDAFLIMKTINAQRYPEQAAELRRAAEGLNVIWIDEHLDGARMKQLFATIDCYISLHRSEGLGLGMAHAMSFGKPVIATGYSGNMDFTTAETCRLVNYSLVELDKDYGVYEKGCFWAEPDTDHAAEQMRSVYEDREAARQLGQRGKAGLEKAMNPETAMKQMRSRLAQIDARFRSL